MIRTPSDKVPIKIMNAEYIARNIFMYIDEFILLALFYQINLITHFTVSEKICIVYFEHLLLT